MSFVKKVVLLVARSTAGDDSVRIGHGRAATSVVIMLTLSFLDDGLNTGVFEGVGERIGRYMGFDSNASGSQWPVALLVMVLAYAVVLAMSTGIRVNFRQGPWSERWLFMSWVLACIFLSTILGIALDEAFVSFAINVLATALFVHFGWSAMQRNTAAESAHPKQLD